MLATLVALFSFVPFEYVAKATLVLCAGLFIFDPFPMSRLVALGATIIVALLSRWHRNWLVEQEKEELEGAEYTKDNKWKSVFKKAD